MSVLQHSQFFRYFKTKIVLNKLPIRALFVLGFFFFVSDVSKEFELDAFSTVDFSIIGSHRCFTTHVWNDWRVCKRWNYWLGYDTCLRGYWLCCFLLLLRCFLNFWYSFWSYFSHSSLICPTSCRSSSLGLAIRYFDSQLGKCLFIFVDKCGHWLQCISALHEIVEGMGSLKGGNFTGLFRRNF